MILFIGIGYDRKNRKKASKTILIKSHVEKREESINMINKEKG